MKEGICADCKEHAESTELEERDLAGLTEEEIEDLEYELLNSSNCCGAALLGGG